MTKRVILLVPEDLAFEDLSETQQEAINIVFDKYVGFMPGTIAYEGYQVVDVLCSDGFDPELMSDYGIEWEIIGMWQRDSLSNELETLVELDEEAWLNYLPDIVEYAEEGEIISTSPPVFQIPHSFSEWPEIK